MPLIVHMIIQQASICVVPRRRGLATDPVARPVKIVVTITMRLTLRTLMPVVQVSCVQMEPVAPPANNVNIHMMPMVMKISFVVRPVFMPATVLVAQQMRLIVQRIP